MRNSSFLVVFFSSLKKVRLQHIAALQKSLTDSITRSFLFFWFTDVMNPSLFPFKTFSFSPVTWISPPPLFLLPPLRLAFPVFLTCFYRRYFVSLLFFPPLRFTPFSFIRGTRLFFSLRDLLQSNPFSLPFSSPSSSRCHTRSPALIRPLQSSFPPLLALAAHSPPLSFLNPPIRNRILCGPFFHDQFSDEESDPSFSLFFPVHLFPPLLRKQAAVSPPFSWNDKERRFSD